MGSISLRNAGLVATDTLFSNLNLVISDGDRVGLVAGNGRGKTTLLRAMAGQGELTSGDIVRSRGLTVGYVEQDMPAAMMGTTLYEAVLDALPPMDRDSDSWRVDVVLDEFETPEAMRHRRLSELSGGWQRIALIARCWVLQPDALLLDEPTNHLDLGKLFQLEAWINQAARNIPVIIASHDRQFLDATTNRTLFLRPDESHVFALPYSRARVAMAEADEAAQAKRERDLKEVSRLRKQAAKLTNIGINSGSDLLTVKSKYLRERAEKIESAALSLHKERSGDIRLGNSGAQARVMLAIENLDVTSPPGDKLFRLDKLHIFQGDRLVILGRNGTGKSQFVGLLHRAMTGRETPGIRVSPQIVPGYVDQAMSFLPPRESPLGYITGRFDQGDQRSKSLLAAAGFAVEAQERPIAELSFGQRARLGLLAIRLLEPNFYLLDEPTNHVDIPGQERLEAEILAHGVTCILVSHDRSFVRGLGNRFLLIENRRLTEVDGPELHFAAMAREAS
ncbi:MAG: ATP-binding cassette domain-containing protein [Alphaproteobacteria bacterium]|nr:ATP-binding cassette domain-containing protein [Alphaproteobacteria bacterium]MBU1560901.1 ATP-binding cassette domain-containing protein [Alphaproteobacteria bacterium]MBU2304875.1 ATP-binding cassette domain-containing protein [Alphaproteobacteria bacterium]MBU2370126.1 ATP-binding cassette domain-containing protein [Alphaproteobacteria bacterium]